jgi:PAS domain S-box-containing protein
LDKHETLSEEDHTILVRLHYFIVELEKLEIQRSRGHLSEEDFEKKCRDLIDRSDVPIGAVQDRRLLLISANLARLIGHDTEDPIGLPLADFFPEEEAPKIQEYYDLRQKGEDAPIFYRSSLKHRSGGVVPIRLVAGLFPYKGRPANIAIIEPESG